MPEPGSSTGDAVRALRRIAFLLERSRAKTYRVRAFRGAAAAIEDLAPDELARLVEQERLRDLPGVGDVTAKVIVEAFSGETPGYLERLEGEAEAPVVAGGAALREALRGDCHTHSDWSDGGSPIREMAEAARDIGHEYMVLTDHSRRLTIANGLTRERILAQIDEVVALNDELAPFRLLAGMEVDILEDGSLDMDEDVLERLDVVVASVHSKLRMESRPMTARMVTALANPHCDILGHCTGRVVAGRGRPESTFDPDIVFAAALRFDKAIEINCRPDRLDPPRRLLTGAVEAGCRFSIDSDAHAPGQLEWLPYGCARAEECGVTADSVVNTLPADDLLRWADGHPSD